MNETHTIRALLDVEDACADVLFEKVPGTDSYLWPLARWLVAVALSSQHLRVVPVQRSGPSGIARLRLIAGRRLPNRASSDRLRSQVENLFIVSGTTRAALPRRTGNWLSDDFALALGDRAAVVQNAPLHEFTPRRERPLNPRTWTYDDANTRIIQAMKGAPLSAAQREELTRLLDEMLRPFADLIDGESRQRVINQVIPYAHRVKYDVQEFSDLLDRTRPRRILMQTAAYGERSHLIRLAHQRGIEVIEPQHGWVGASHSAYNFGRAMTGTELTTCLPDTFLTFGEYWGRDLRFPGRLVHVGKPALNRTVEEAAPFEARPYRLLLVSSVYERDKLTAAAQVLRTLLPASWEIAIRPHPSERATAAELFAEALLPGVVLDQETEASAAIAGSRAVVGLISTVLYEALPLGTHIGVIDTDLSPHYSDISLFPRRLNDEPSFASFVESIQRDTPPAAEVNEHVWKPNAVQTLLSLTS